MNSHALNFQHPAPAHTHTCQSRREGEWIIWTCRQCESYERRLNLRTGAMWSHAEDEETLHTGIHLPVGVDAKNLGPVALN
jgi:hypothetical protein